MQPSPRFSLVRTPPAGNQILLQIPTKLLLDQKYLKLFTTTSTITTNISLCLVGTTYVVSGNPIQIKPKILVKKRWKHQKHLKVQSSAFSHSVYTTKHKFHFIPILLCMRIISLLLFGRLCHHIYGQMGEKDNKNRNMTQYKHKYKCKWQDN